MLSICLYVSSATPTTINIPVPPNDTADGNLVITPNITGNPAITHSVSAHTKVTLLSTLETYSSVSFPGLIPGINPPFLFKFLAISSVLIATLNV